MRGVKYPSLGMLLFCVSPPGVGAVETGVSAGLSAEWSDNVFLTNQDRRSDWVESLNLGANLHDQEALYQYSVDYAVSHERYERDSFDAVTNYNGRANLNLAPFPRRFEWNNSIQSETTERDSRALDTPDNRDQRNIFTTAPTLALLLMPRDRVTLNGSAERVTFRESDASESNRAGGNLDWTHALTSLMDLSLTVGQDKVQFEEEEDYRTTDYQVGFNRRINGGNINLRVGQIKLEPEFSEESDEPQYEATVDWGNELHAVNFQAYHTITDTSVGTDRFFEPADLLDDPNDVNTDEVEIVKRTRYSLGYTYGSERTYTIGPSVYLDQEEAVDGSSDILRKGFNLLLMKSLSAHTNTSFQYNFSRDDSKDYVPVVSREVEYEHYYRLALEHAIGEMVGLQFWLTREEGNRELSIEDYEVHTVGASVGLTF